MIDDDPKLPAVMLAHDLWRIAIALLLEGKRTLNHEDCEHSLRSETYDPE